MSYPLFGALIAALVTAGLLWLTLPYALRVGMVDKPGGRKDHSVPTPTIGGVAIAIGLLTASFMFGQPDRALLSLFAAGSMLLVVGALDDQYDVRWYWRVLAQVSAALILIFWGGVRVSHIGPLLGASPFELGMWSVPFTVVGTVGVINAINMCDGVDGLAGIVCTVALAMLGITALYAGNSELLAQIEPMLGALLAFLLFNMRSPWVKRAKVFLGNAGSGMLGLTIAWVAFRVTQSAAHPVSPVLAPWLLAPPLIDCLVLMMRRIKMGRSPFQADRDHLHHLLLAAGFTPTQVALGLGGLTCLLGIFAASSVEFGADRDLLLVLAFGLLTLGYYWLTSRRVRAVDAFSRIRNWGSAPAQSARLPTAENATVAFGNPEASTMLSASHRVSMFPARSGSLRHPNAVDSTRTLRRRKAR